jgi:O-antigen/teichoic acid export membrane protein
MSHTRTLLADGRTLPAAVATIGAAVANIVLNLALVPAFGITGSALATFLSYLALQALLGMFAHRVLPLPHVSRMLTAELALTVGLAFLATQVPVSIPFLVIRGVLALASGAIFATMLASLIRTPRHRPNAIAGWLQSRLRLAAV